MRNPLVLRNPIRSKGVRLNQRRPPLRLVISRKNSDTSQNLPTLSAVPFKMLPIVSLETCRERRMLGQLERIKGGRPITFEVIEKMLDRTCEQMDREQTG